MSEGEGETSSILESPEVITKRIEGQIIRGALDEERRAEKALVLLRARDSRIAYLEKKIGKLENRAVCDTRDIPKMSKFSFNNSSVKSSSRETTYLSVSPTEVTSSPSFSDRVIFEENQKNSGKSEKFICKSASSFEKLFTTKETMKNLDILSVPLLKLPKTFGHEVVVLKNVNTNLNESSSLTSDESHQDESSVNLVVTAALAFSKFDDVQCRANDRAKVLPEKRELNDREDKKQLASKSSRRNLFFTKHSTSLPGIKTRRERKKRKRGIERRIGKNRDNSLPSRNLNDVEAGLNESLKKSMKLPKDDTSKPNARGTESSAQKQKVEDKVVGEDAQEAASIPYPIFKFERKIASTQTCKDFNDKFDDPTEITSVVESSDDFFNRKEFSKIWSPADEPAPQWLIEEALKRGEKNIENNEEAKTNFNRNNVEKDISSNFNDENIIADLEKQLCATRDELAKSLSEQLIIKSKYKKALKIVKIAADEERDELQRKLVKICTSVLDKFGPNALNDKAVKSCHKRHQRPLQHYGKLSKKMHRKLKIATLASSQLKREIIMTRKELDEKSLKYDSMMKCLTSLKMKLKNMESTMSDLLNENTSLRKKIDDAREWMQTRVSKERHEKINAAQFREIQRSRELANLKKKNDEDVSTIAQLRGKLLRSESANSNKGFLLNRYKGQLADLAKEKDILLGKNKELEIDNNLLRNTNAQLRDNLTLINGEREKIAAETEKSEKSEMDIRERMESKLAIKYERSMLQKIDTMRAEYEKIIEAIEIKLNFSENSNAEYREAIKHFLKEIHEYNRELDAERDMSCSEASEREAHETACEILNITPGELTRFLKGRSTDKINYWHSRVKEITTKKCFAEDLGQFLFNRAIGSTKN